MTNFDERKSAFEAKFANDQQVLFRAEARACKAFGLFLAEKMGLTGDAAVNYANDLVVKNLDEPGLDDVIDIACDDFTAKGIAHTRVDLATHLNELYAQAMDLLTNETGK